MLLDDKKKIPWMTSFRSSQAGSHYWGRHFPPLSLDKSKLYSLKGFFIPLFCEHVASAPKSSTLMTISTWSFLRFSFTFYIFLWICLHFCFIRSFVRVFVCFFSLFVFFLVSLSSCLRLHSLAPFCVIASHLL